jgi:thiamine biosynthesis lipoprotein
MGMPMSIHLRGTDLADPGVERTVAAAFAELARMEGIFSTWKPDSPVSRVRRGELAVTDCDPLVAESVQIGAQAQTLTEGAFTTSIPDAAGIPRFDPTGLVKGWAVARAGELLATIPRVSWCVNAGGDVLVGRHRHVPPTGPDAGPWKVGVEDPHDRSRIARVVAVTAGAVATSGTAARGAHLYDPRNGWMVSRLGSTTVVGPDLLWADIWATALFVGDGSTREAFARNAPGYTAFDL